ncbi:MAG TPA: efflux RND transporter periplasmic adaptor subunit [Gemmataceae bacterium]|nr:efflux RND transporter periplasmic adaptor subunit [Gemmataceae bacterium]
MKSILMSGLLGVLTCVGLAGCGGHAAPKGFGPKGPPEVYVSAAVTREILDFEEFPGRLEADKTVQIRARVTGYLLRFNFKEGGMIEKDDVLFEIDPQLYEAELALAEGNVRQAEGEYEQAESNWRRTDRLSKMQAGAINLEEIVKYRGAFVIADGKLKSAKANLKKAQVNMGYTKVRAPIAGQISKSMIDPGNLVVADNTILTSIGTTDPMKASFDVDERTLARVLRLMKEGVIPHDPTGLPVDMWMADQTDRDKPMRGKIDFYDTYVDTATGTLRVRGQFSNEDDLLVPGMFVRVRLYIGKPQQSLLIAEKALVTDQGQKFLYVLKSEETSKQEGEVEYRPVEIGRLSEGLRVIRPYEEMTNEKGEIVKKGLKLGEKVVTSGLQRIQRGSKVKYTEVAMPVSAPSQTILDPTKVPSANPAKVTPATKTKHHKGAGKKGR